MRAVNDNGDLLPPWPPFALALIEPDRNARWNNCALHTLSQARSCNVHAVVEIELAAAILARIDIELQRSLRSLHRALNEWLPQQDRTGAHEHRKLAELRRQRQLGLGHWLTGPVIVPAARGQAYREGLRRFHFRRPGNH